MKNKAKKHTKACMHQWGNLEHLDCTCKAEVKHARTPFDSIGGPKGGFARDLYRNLREIRYFESVATDIVRAVNSHEALLDAAKDILSKCKKSLLFSAKFLEPLERAIAQAEGK